MQILNVCGLKVIAQIAQIGTAPIAQIVIAQNSSNFMFLTGHQMLLVKTTMKSIVKFLNFYLLKLNFENYVIFNSVNSLKLIFCSHALNKFIKLSSIFVVFSKIS